MKRLLAFLLFIPLLSFASIDITNIPLGGWAMTDTLLGVTNNNYAARGTVLQIVGTATNGYPWTNLTAINAFGVIDISTNTLPIGQVTTPGAILTNGQSVATTFSNTVTVVGGTLFTNGENWYTGQRISEFAYDGNAWITVRAVTGSGQSAGIYLQRGTTNDAFNDWTISDTGGQLVFSPNYGGSSALTLDSGGAIATFTGTVNANSTTDASNPTSSSAVKSAGGLSVAKQIYAGSNGWFGGTLAATNGAIQMVKPSFTTNFTCTTNLQTYLLNGTAPQVITLPNAANVPNVIYRFSTTNDAAHYILTNATGTQTIADGSSLSYTNSGSGKAVVSLMSDGAHWWLMGKAKTRLPCAQFSTQTNTTFLNITNTITLQTTDFNNNLGIGVDNSAWFTAGIGSRIYCTNLGAYMITISAIWSKTSGSADNGDIWLRQSSIDIPNSMTLLTIPNTATNVMTVNFLVNVVTNNTYFDFQGASTGGAGQLQAMPAITSPFNRPACPSVIVTVNKVSD